MFCRLDVEAMAAVDAVIAPFRRFEVARRTRFLRNFTPLMQQVDAWKQRQLTDDKAKAVIYDAFIGNKLDAPKHLARLVGDSYFNPKYPDFEPRTSWSLQNAFTSAFKVLDPLPQFRATASLGEFFA